MKFGKITAALTGFAMLGLAAHANAVVAVDQNASVNNTYMAGFSQGDLAQSFQQTADNIAGAGVFLTDAVGGGDADITISLWSDLPNQFGAALLASGTASISSNNQWVDVFWSAAPVNALTTYFLVFTSTNSDYGIAGDVNNGYAQGQVYANSGFGSFSGYDYTFRTFAEYRTGNNVPEPATLALFGLGVAGMGLARRKR